MDFATLVLAADSRGLVQGEQALDRLASTAERTETRTGKAMGNLAKSTEQVGRQSIFASQQSRMMAMQLSQVAQQASATGDWIRAIAVQLPDLTLAFGTIGIAAGVAAGALLPLIANLVSSSDQAKVLEEAFDNLKSATEAYEEAVENASMSADELVGKFGEQAIAAQRVYEAMRRLRELEFNESIEKAQTAISQSLSGLQESLDQFDLASTTFGHPEAIAAISTQVQNLENNFGLTLVQATRVNDALDALSAANGPSEIADAAGRLGLELQRATDEGARLSPELRAVQKSSYTAALEAARFANLIGDSIGLANGLAGAMGAVADEAARAAANADAAEKAAQTLLVTNQLRANSQLDPLNGFNRTPFEDEQDIMNRRAEATKSQYQLTMEKLSRGGGGRRSGGGGGGASRISDEEREAKRWFEETRTEAEKYAAELEKLNDLHERGYVNADTYARAVKQLGEDYHETSEAAQFFNDIGEDLKNGILDAIVEGENLGDVFEDLAKSIARAALEAALFGSGPLAGGGGKGGGGGILGGVFSFLPKLFSFDGGGYTGSGSRSGGLDGKGGYMALVHPQETIIDHTKGGGAATQAVSDVRVSVDNNGNLQAYVLRTAQREAANASATLARQVPSMAVNAQRQVQTRSTRPGESGGAKVGHGSGGIMLLRAE